MATETGSGNQIDTVAVWRAVGRLKGNIGALKEGQQEIRAQLRESQNQVRAELREGQQELRSDIRELNRRIDRLLYAGIAVGGALFVDIAASRFIGG